MQSLNLYDLHKHDSGIYICSGMEYRRQLSIDVLYPPGKAEIHGPYAVEKGSRRTLSCEADSNPPATYWWKYSTSREAKVVKTGSTISLPAVQNSYTWLHCFAKNTMVSTVGPAVMSPVVHTARHIDANQVPAHIVGLPSTYTTYSGFTIDITCDVEGVPSPTVWWSKQSDVFIRSGNRLIQENVQKSFAGIYVCNAKNTVKENGTGRATKYIDIKIVAQYHPWTIAATASGWIATLSVLELALVHIVRRRMKHGTSEETRRKTVYTTESDTARLHGLL